LMWSACQGLPGCGPWPQIQQLVAVSRIALARLS
jgi:hypothetical protein